MTEQIAGRRLSDLDYPASASGADVYGEKNGVSVRIQLGSAGGVDVGVRADLGSTDAGKGSDAVKYRDPVNGTPKSVTDVLRGHALSVFQGIDPGKHAGIAAHTWVEDQAPAINAFLTAAFAAGHGKVYFPAGTFYVAAPIVVPGDMVIEGAGLRTIIRAMAGTSPTALINLNGQNAVCRNLSVSGADATPGAGISITTTGQFCEISGVWAAQLPIAFRNVDSQAWRIEKCSMISCDFGVFSDNDGRNSYVDRCHIEGGTGLWFTSTTLQPEGVRITNNTILPSITANPNSGHGIVFNCGLELYVGHNVVDNVDKNALLLAATGGKAISHFKSEGNWYSSLTTDAVLAYGNVADSTWINDTMSGAALYGMRIGIAAFGALQRCRVESCHWLANTGGDLVVELATDLTVTGNSFKSATQPYREESNTITGRVFDNTFPILPPVRSTASVYWDNKGPEGINDTDGVWVPTYTNVANSTAISHGSASWAREGNTVHASGALFSGATAAGTLTQIRVSPPAGHAVGAGKKATGICTIYDGANFASGNIVEHASGDIMIQFKALITGSMPISWVAQWRK